MELSVWAETSTLIEGSAIRICAMESSATYEAWDSLAVPGANPIPGITPATIPPVAAGRGLWGGGEGGWAGGGGVGGRGRGLGWGGGGAAGGCRPPGLGA